MATYGDGVADVDVRALLRFHDGHGKLATVTTVRPPARFGQMIMEGDRVREFAEKPQTGEGWINGGFFVLNRKALDYIDGDETLWEREPMERLAPRRPAHGLPPRRLLPADGHAPGEAAARGPVGVGQSAVEGLDLDGAQHANEIGAC